MPNTNSILVNTVIAVIIVISYIITMLPFIASSLLLVITTNTIIVIVAIALVMFLAVRAVTAEVQAIVLLESVEMAATAKASQPPLSTVSPLTPPANGKQHNNRRIHMIEIYS